MKLKDIFMDCENLKDIEINDTDIRDISYDSRKVKEGSIFVAIKGEKYDGHNFIKDAINKGAIVIVCEDRYLNEYKRKFNKGIIFIGVPNTRKALSCICNNFFGRPSEKMTLIGVTGTNGKTTTTYIIKSILDKWGKRTGLIGTIQYMILDKVYPAIHTTPESLEYHGILKEMLSSGCTHAISEVSSHALAQYRVDGARFKIAVFTNLTRDHLDFHHTMEDYYLAKQRLFKELLDDNGIAVINIDDKYGSRLVDDIRYNLNSHNKNLKILSISNENKEADIYACDIRSKFNGLDFNIIYNNNVYPVSSKLTGLINVYNIVSGFAVAIALDIPWSIISEGIKEVKLVRGRFEKVDLGQSFLCIIDYAHTSDALERLIKTARELINEHISDCSSKNKPRIITVFGCGGDRDPGKRPEMGRIATQLSDLTIITSDNPRTEEPLSIIRDIEAGVVSKNYIVIPDREKAIEKAINIAEPDDIVLIAGKGHEDYQEINGKRYKFSDKEVAEKYIKSRILI